MLHSIFPKVDHKFLSMPLWGPVADGFDDWLAANGYTRRSRKHAIQVLRHIDLDLRRRRIGEVARLTHAVLEDCWRDRNKLFPGDAGTVRTLERYLISPTTTYHRSRNEWGRAFPDEEQVIPHWVWAFPDEE